MARPGLSSRQVTRRGGGGGPAVVSSGRDVARQWGHSGHCHPASQADTTMSAISCLSPQSTIVRSQQKCCKKIVNFDNNWQNYWNIFFWFENN